MTGSTDHLKPPPWNLSILYRLKRAAHAGTLLSPAWTPLTSTGRNETHTAFTATRPSSPGPWAPGFNQTSTVEPAPRGAHPRSIPGQTILLMGREVLSERSRPKRADAQRLVTTRLLDHLHDPLAATRSSAEDPSPRDVKWQSVDEVRQFLNQHPLSTCSGTGPEAYSYPTTTCGIKSSRSGTDSDLEAFSHNPADGSFAALPCQTAAKTNYLNQRFLSY